MIIIILLCIATIYLMYLFRIERFQNNSNLEMPKETKRLDTKDTKKLDMTRPKIKKESPLDTKPKQPMYCDIMPSNVSESDMNVINDSYRITQFKKVSESPKPSTHIFYEKIMNTPNTTFKPKKIFDNIHYWKCRDDINRPWYQCE